MSTHFNPFWSRFAHGSRSKDLLTGDLTRVRLDKTKGEGAAAALRLLTFVNAAVLRGDDGVRLKVDFEHPTWDSKTRTRPREAQETSNSVEVHPKPGRIRNFKLLEENAPVVGT